MRIIYPVLAIILTITAIYTSGCNEANTGGTQETIVPPVSTVTKNSSTGTIIESTKPANVSPTTAQQPASPTTQAQINIFPTAETGILNASAEDISWWLFQSNISFKIIDVRTPDEFAGGHVTSAINIDFRAADFEQNIDKLDKNAYYIVYCRTGVRSAGASELLLQHGFTHIINMTGGINEWLKEGYPVVD